MTAPIYFNIEEAQNQLLNHHIVFTLRKPRKTVGYTTARQGNYTNFHSLGKVFIELVKVINNKSELEPFVKFSGFETVEKWLEKASEDANHLYLVILN